MVVFAILQLPPEFNVFALTPSSCAFLAPTPDTHLIFGKFDRFAFAAIEVGGKALFYLNHSK